MKARVTASDLHRILSWADKAAPVGRNDAHWAGLLLEAEPTKSGGMLHVHATNVGAWASTSLDAGVVDGGRILLPRTVLSPLSKLDKRSADIVASDTEATISADGRTVSMRLLPMDDFPKVVKPETPSVRCPELREVLGLAAEHAHTDQSSSPALCGVHLGPDAEGRFAVHATDRYTMFCYHSDLPWEAGEDVLLPTAGARTAARMGDEVTLATDRLIWLSDGTCEVGSARIEGIEVPYERMVPAPDGVRTVVNASVPELTDALELAASVSERHAKTGQVVVVVHVSEAGLRVESVGKNDSAESRCEAAVEGDAVSVGFNEAYLRRAMAVGEGGRVKLHVTSDVKPVLVTRPDGTGPRAIVMPVRL